MAFGEMVTSLFIISCGTIFFKPLHFSNATTSPACGVPETMVGRAKIVDDLLRNKAGTTEEMRLSADFGSADKFVKVFKNNDIYTMVFHFIDHYDYDFIQGNMSLSADSIKIEKGIQLDPASTVISEMSDQYYYIYLSQYEMKTLAFSKSMTGKIGPINIELSYGCRAGWRTLCEEK